MHPYEKIELAVREVAKNLIKGALTPKKLKKDAAILYELANRLERI